MYNKSAEHRMGIYYFFSNDDDKALSIINKAYEMCSSRYMTELWNSDMYSNACFGSVHRVFASMNNRLKDFDSLSFYVGFLGDSEFTKIVADEFNSKFKNINVTPFTTLNYYKINDPFSGKAISTEKPEIDHEIVELCFIKISISTEYNRAIRYAMFALIAFYFRMFMYCDTYPGLDFSKKEDNETYMSFAIKYNQNHPDNHGSMSSYKNTTVDLFLKLDDIDFMNSTFNRDMSMGYYSYTSKPFYIDLENTTYIYPFCYYLVMDVSNKFKEPYDYTNPKHSVKNMEGK